ncbi:MAG TPA: mechanosensitive ion channel family protein, partial [Chthonomonadaceae bacterium]|nr:mechanosensitive ion channel family protein [Chthonomonadaceae bacterium]
MKWSPSSIFTPAFWIDFWREITHNALHALLQIVAILLVYLILRLSLFGLIDGVLARLLARERRLSDAAERAGRLKTLQGLCKSVVGYVLFFLFGILFLSAVGFNIVPFITTAGVIGLAIGFGAQKLVKDSISGFFIIIDNQFVVGDTITVGTTTGRVQEMGMRTTTLVDPGGRVHILSNGDIGMVTNLSRNPVVDSIEVNLAAGADLPKAIEVLNTAGDALFAQEGHNLLSAPRVLGITAFSAASLTLRVSVVSDPDDLPGEQMRVRAAMRDTLL